MASMLTCWMPCSSNKLKAAEDNPWNLNHSAGGSSGGSAAAVAAGIVPVAHATDGGGSIRVPASANGLFGLKPTRGRVSNGPSVDEVWSGLAVQLGVSRSVRDSAALLDVAHGGGVGEPYLTKAPQTSFLAEASRDPKRLRIGVMYHPRNGMRSAPKVVKAIKATASLCEALGHDVSEADLDLGLSWESFVHANAQFWTLNTAAWIDFMSSLTGHAPTPEFLEPATLAVYKYGLKVSGLDMVQALNVRNSVARACGEFFQRFDMLLTPTLPQLPPLIGQYGSSTQVAGGLEWIETVFGRSPFTAIANMAGIPAMSVPLAIDDKTGLPMGSQFFEGFGNDALLFNLAGQIERAAPWIDRHPSVWAGR